jgi:hypothetical protein
MQIISFDSRHTVGEIGEKVNSPLPCQMVYFISVLSFTELAPEERLALKRLIFEYLNAFTTTSIVFRFFSNCKQLANLILSTKWICLSFI